MIHRGSFRAALGLLVAGAVLLLAHGAVPGAQAVTSNLPTFGQPTISGIQGMGFEQNLRLDPTNPDRIYTSAPGSASSDTSWIWHSEDGGKTFKWVPAAIPTQGKVIPCPGGGDTELAVDAAGHLYFADLFLINFSTARSDDHGVTFKGLPGSSCNSTSVPDFVVDRQWYATDGDATSGGNIYLTSNEVARDQPVCGSSNQGNNVLVVYRSPLPPDGSLAGIVFGPGYNVTTAFMPPCSEGIMGNVEVSPKTHRIFVIHDNAFLDTVAIARCSTVPFLQDPRGLTCVDLPVATFPGYRTAGNFPQLAVDKNGNLYAVWEQAPIDDVNGYVIGDTVLKYSYSTDEGNHWSAPITIPTPELHNNVYASAAAGDDGRVDIAWYGTASVANDDDPLCGRHPDEAARAQAGVTGTATGGPDAVVNGLWSVYFTQTLNGHSASPTFATPIQASGHYVHKGGMQTIIGALCGQRWLGDFLQMRIGSKGEAHIAYVDSNNIAGSFLATHAMYVRQNGGTSTSSANPLVSGDPILLNGASDPAGDGRFDGNGAAGAANMPNLDILDSSMSKPATGDCHPADTPCYRVTLTVNDLTSLAPGSGVAAGDTVLRWLTQWLVPASPSCTDNGLLSACSSGGKNFMVYAESNNGAAVRCFSGQNATAPTGFTVGPMLTYPGTAEITGDACSVTRGARGTITIDVPISQVSLPNTAPLDDTLYSVTASTMTQAHDTDTNPFGFDLGVPVGGVPFNLVDVVRGYNANFTTADLSVAMTDSPDPIKKDKPLTYTITVSNDGPAAASGVTLTDKLPLGVQLKSLKTSQGTCTSAKANNVITATCALGSMANAASATVTITIAHLTAGTMTNTASATAQSPPDPNGASDTASTTVTR